MLNDMIFLTNNVLDRENAHAVKAAGLPMGADDDPLTGVNRTFALERALRDLRLQVAVLDRLDGAAIVIDGGWLTT